MGQYIPQLQPNRRRRINPAVHMDMARVTTLGVFTVLLGFFVALCAGSTPNEDKTLDVLTTLQSTFKPLRGNTDALQAPAPVPPWLESADEGTASPLEAMRATFPDAFSHSADNWGSVQLQFTPDRFQAFILDQPALAQRLFQGFAGPRSNALNDEEYVIEATIGLKGRSLAAARSLGSKIRQELKAVGVHPSRLLLGYEANSETVVLRMTPTDHYEGVL